MRAGVEDVWGSSPLRLDRYAALFEEFPLDRMWRLLSVEHVLTWRKELFGPSELLGEFPQATDTTYLHRLPEPRPWAWLVGAVRPANDEEALALLADHQFNLDVTAVLVFPLAREFPATFKAPLRQRAQQVLPVRPKPRCSCSSAARPTCTWRCKTRRGGCC